jgi:hypothetical protein
MIVDLKTQKAADKLLLVSIRWLLMPDHKQKMLHSMYQQQTNKSLFLNI